MYFGKNNNEDQSIHTFFIFSLCTFLFLRGEGALPINGLVGMCCWLGSHFLDWTDYNQVAFFIGWLEWGHTFPGF